MFILCLAVWLNWHKSHSVCDESSACERHPLSAAVCRVKFNCAIWVIDWLFQLHCEIVDIWVAASRAHNSICAILSKFIGLSYWKITIVEKSSQFYCPFPFDLCCGLPCDSRVSSIETFFAFWPRTSLKLTVGLRSSGRPIGMLKLENLWCCALATFIHFHTSNFSWWPTKCREPS